MPGQIPTQADKRRSAILFDQHRPPRGWFQMERITKLFNLKGPLVGRPWFASIEKASGFPTGLVSPLFDVPHSDLLPPQKYLSFPVDQPGRLEITYVPWDGDLVEGLRSWEEQRNRYGALVHGAAYDPHAPPTVQLVQLIGPKPMSPLPVRAMIQGNAWALGFTTQRPKEADRFFPPANKDEGPKVFSDTEALVFTEAEEEGAEAGAPQGGQTLADLLAEVDSRCPAHLKGAARKAWAMAELGRMATQEA